MTSRKKRISVLILTFMLILSMALFAGCGDKDNEFVAEGQTTIIENPKNEPDKYTSKEQLYIIAGKLKNSEMYSSTVVGETVSKMPRYVQSIEDKHIKVGEESYNYSKSTSLLVNMGKEAFFSGDKVVFRDAEDIKNDKWSEELNVTTYKDYRSHVGVDPVSLTNYILNDESIISATTEKLDDNNYKITCSVDTSVATPYYAIRMRNYGDLAGLPDFSSCKFEIVFDDNFYPKTIKSNDEYTIEKGILKMNCESELVETFDFASKDITIPSAELFRSKLGNDVSNVENSKLSEGSDLLFNTILDLDTKEGIKIKGDASVISEEKEYVIPVDGWMSFDFDKYPESGLNTVFTGRVDTSLFGLNVNITYIGDNYLYVNIGTTKYKYLLSEENDQKISMETFVNSMVVTEGERKGDFRYFELKLNDATKQAIKNIIHNSLANLPGFISGAELEFNDIILNFTLKKESKTQATMVDVSAFADFGTMDLNADVIIAEKPETLPEAEAFSEYVEADWNNLVNNFKFIGKIIDGVELYDMETGVQFDIDLALKSKTEIPQNFGFNFVVAMQDTLDGLLAHIVVNNSLLTAKNLGVELYYKDDTIHIVILDKKGETPAVINYFNVKSSTLKGLIVSLISEDIFADSNITVDSVIELLADFALNSRIQEGADENTEELYFSDDITAEISVIYQQIINKILSLKPLGMEKTMEEAFGSLNFAIDDVVISTKYVDKDLDSLEVSLVNNETSEVGKGEKVELSCLISDLSVMQEGTMTEIFTILESRINEYANSGKGNLIANYRFASRLIDGVKAYDYETGTNVVLNVGFAPLVISINGQLQNNETNGFRGKFSLGSEFMIDDGILYTVDVKTENGVIYPIKVSEKNLTDMAGNVLPSIVGGLDVDKLIVNLTSLILQSEIKSETTEDGIEKVQFIFSEIVKNSVSEVYQMGINKVLSMDNPTINSLKPIIAMLNFPLDSVSISAEFKGEQLTGAKLLLTNNTKNPFVPGTPISIEAGIVFGETMKEGEMDDNFALINKGYKAMEESKTVRADADKLESDGLALTPEYKARLDKFEEDFNKLSKEAQMTVLNYGKIKKLSTDYTNYLKGADEFIANVNDFVKFDSVTSAESYKLLNATINPSYKSLKGVQKEYIGKDLLDQYLAKKDEFEKTYGVAILNKKISDSLKVTAPTLELTETLKEIKNEYGFLNEENKTNVVDFDKIQSFIGTSFKQALTNIGGIDNVVAGDECYNKIKICSNLRYMLDSEQTKTTYKTEITEFNAIVKKHRDSETKAVDNLIIAMGTTSFSPEYHEKLVSARTAFENLRMDYKGSVTKRGDLWKAEVNYVKLSIGDLTPSTLKVTDEEVITNARNTYNEAINAYEEYTFFKNNISKNLSDFNNTLTSLEEKLAELKA